MTITTFTYCKVDWGNLGHPSPVSWRRWAAISNLVNVEPLFSTVQERGVPSYPNLPYGHFWNKKKKQAAEKNSNKHNTDTMYGRFFT